MANEYASYSPTAYDRTLHTTLVDHIREEEAAWMRNFAFYALLDANGRIEYNCSGAGFDWPVRYRKHNLQGYTGETPTTFTRRNLWQTAKQEYRGYQVSDAMYEKEFLENRGTAAVIPVFGKMVERLTESIKQGLSTQPFIDGDATGNEQFWHGFESFLAINGTVNATDGTQRSSNAADIVGYPNDTYAGLSTILGNYGGANSTGDIWPNGVADPEYDFWSPIIVNTTSTHAEMPSSTNTWAGQADEALRYGIIQAQRNSTMDGQMDVVFLTRSAYGALLNLIDAKEQININGGAQTQLRSLGFKNVLYFDGCEITWDTSVPSTVYTSTVNRGYGMNINNVTIRSMYDTLLKPEGPEYDMDDSAYKCRAKTLSNLKFKSPRNVVTWRDIA